MAELLYRNPVERFLTMIIDIFVFLFKSIFYLAEAFYLTILPNQWRNKKDVTGQVVLITGGGGGVGRHLALNFAKLNARVVVWDINFQAIRTTINLLEENGYQCKGYVVDISSREQVYEKAKQVQEEIGNVDILVNNAGIVCCKPFWDLSDRIIQNTFNINIISHYWTVKAFLPEMIKKNRGHIVTVGSATGLLGTYGCTDYSATKFACNGFHESLLTELRTHGYNGVEMTLVCPYYINTGMFSGVRPRLFPMLEPDFVANKISDAVQNNETWCVLPQSMKGLVFLKCLLPSKMLWELIQRVMRTPQSMMLYQGRGKVAAG